MTALGSRAEAVEAMAQAAYSHPDGTPWGMAAPPTKMYFRAQQERAYDALISDGVICDPRAASGEPRGPVGLVPGHSLWSGGAPHDERGNRIDGNGGGRGRGVCRCGELSGVLPSTFQRKRWHREHKAAIAAAADETTLAGTRDMRDLTPRDIGRKVAFEHNGHQVAGDLRQVYAIGDYGDQISLEVNMPKSAMDAQGLDGTCVESKQRPGEEDTWMVAYDDVSGYIAFPGTGTPS